MGEGGGWCVEGGGGWVEGFGGWRVEGGGGGWRLEGGGSLRATSGTELADLRTLGPWRATDAGTETESIWSN